MNLLNTQQITNHLYDQVQHSTQTQQQHFAVLLDLMDTDIQLNNDHMFSSIPSFHVTEKNSSLSG